ncbi:hypothetical protein [uncultured Gammaproteobacteria bacterium]|nr:hypothetical protein [uncultured Gammaproteobacteria bacterium]
MYASQDLPTNVFKNILFFNAFWLTHFMQFRMNAYIKNSLVSFLYPYTQFFTSAKIIINAILKKFSKSSVISNLPKKNCLC